MEIEKLSSFIEVYNCISIAIASENLFISPSALSRRIGSLETELQTELFLRNGAALMPTEAAKMLYKEATKIVQQHNSAKMKMQQFKRGVGGILRVGVLSSMQIGPTARAIARMRELYPDVELILECDSGKSILTRSAATQIDVGLTAYGEISGVGGLHYELLAENTMAAMIGRGHRLWKKRPLYVEDLKGEVIYFLNSVDQSNASVMQFIKNQKIDFASRIQCHSAEELVFNVAKGGGISLTGVITSELFYSVRDVIDIVPLERTALEYGYIVAVYDKENETAQKFVKLLKEYW